MMQSCVECLAADVLFGAIQNQFSAPLLLTLTGTTRINNARVRT